MGLPSPGRYSPGMKSLRAGIHGIDTHVASADGGTFFVPHYAVHRPVAQRILAGKLAEPPLHRLVGEVQEAYPGSMVHAGTFFGDMLPSFSAKTPNRVYAFEPVLENYLLARAVVEVNHLENVVLLHAGLGREIGVADIGVGDLERHLGGASHFNAKTDSPTARTQRTTVLTVDQMGIEDLTMLQLDVEGFELEVLHGAEKTIAEHHPVVVVEDGQRNCAEFLQDLGYAFHGRIANNFLYLIGDQGEKLGYPRT